MAAGARSEGDVLEAIARGELAPIYALAGAERYLVDRCVEALRRAVLGPQASSQPSFNYDVFELKESGLGAALAAARTMPMFAKRRLVFGRGLDLLKAAELEPLVAYVADPNPSTCLVLVTEKADKLDGRLKSMQALRKAGYAHEFPRLRAHELPRWIGREAQSRGITFTPAAAQALAAAIGPTLGPLSQAIDQLALFAGPGATVDAEHVERLIPDSRSREIFELTRAIGEGDRPRALALCGALLVDREPALRIQGSLLRQLRQIWRAKELLAAGVPRFDIAGRVGVPPFVLDEILAPARRVSRTGLERAFRRLYEADKALKSSRLGDDLLVMRLVDNLVRDLAPERTSSGRGPSVAPRP